MPNWCENSLTVSGPGADDVWKALGVDPDGVGVKFEELFARTSPMPEELTQYTSPPRPARGESPIQFQERVARLQTCYGAADWYDWANTHWGTKWEASHAYLAAPGTIAYTTAWCPPVAWLTALSKAHPTATLVAAYAEAGMQFAGTDTYVGGELVDTATYDGSWFVEINEDGDTEYSDELDNFLNTRHLQSAGG